MERARHIDGYVIRSWIGEDAGHAVGFAECPVCGRLCEARHRGISARMLRLLAEDYLQKHLAESHMLQQAATG